MGNVFIKESTLSDIGDAIREKTGKSDLIIPSDMPAEIKSISSGGGDIDAVIDGTITEINSNATSIRDYCFHSNNTLQSANFPLAKSVGKQAFYENTNLTEVKLPALESIGSYAFDGCIKLNSIDLSNLKSAGDSMFSGCKALTSVDIPLVTELPNRAFCNNPLLRQITAPSATILKEYAFSQCINLKEATFPLVTAIEANCFADCYNSLSRVDFPSLESIARRAFYGSRKLKILILRNPTTIVSLGQNVLDGTLIDNGQGQIYVPSSLIEGYKVATNWSNYASQFRALEDYTVDGTITGELDESKI